MTDAETRIARARRIVAESRRADGGEVEVRLPRTRRLDRAEAKGKLTIFLLASGWTRSPAEVVDDCGADTDISICHNPARWQKGAGAALCAQHAAQAERWGTR